MHIRKVPTPEEFNRVVESIWKEQSTPAQRRNVHPNLAKNFIRAFYRQVMKKPFPYKLRIGTGNRRTWCRWGVFTVNPDQGWHDINHDMGHWLERQLTGGAHTNQQLRFERDGATLICRRFLSDEPYANTKPEKDVQVVRAARVDANIKRWEAKLKRASNALKKLKTKKRYYDKVLAERGS